ncbi:hypothetical protein FTO68_08650 [Methanocalculus taiwanensis]|uniref:Uncharacterized protein n=1 Tax=Methanocalculus taiwanensis TaxID=106207 RepID=A0ABD4TJT0_9EURY|nr:hypothetical protein [Methanocalculus taiwanensis]MCQ1539046.1 hypothetical protein [Methanocalculus taiwanensis]
MKDKTRIIKKQKGASRDHLSCVRRHPIPALFFTFLGGMGIGAFMANKIMKGREQRAETKQGGIAPLIMTLVTPYILRRILRMITG